MKQINLIQGSAEWHEFRRQHIGASDAAVLMGCGFQKPNELWEEKLGLRARLYPNSAMIRGQNLEPLALAHYNLWAGIHVPAVFESAWLPFLSASMDGVNITPDNRIHSAVEIKCCGPEMHSKLMQGNIPDYYNAQLQHQMLVLDLPVIHLFAYHSPESNRAIPVKRDDDYIGRLIERCIAFWDCVKNLTPPDPRPIDMSNNPEWIESVHAWMCANHALKHAESIERDARNHLIEISNGVDAQGCGVKLKKIVRRGGVDYEQIPELRGVNLERYRKSAVISYRITEE